MSAIDLLNDTPCVADEENWGPIMKEWVELFGDIIRVVSHFKEVDPNWVQIFHRKKSASASIDTWINNTMGYLRRNNSAIEPKVCYARDLMKYAGSTVDLKSADNEPDVVKMLNSSSKVKEPKRLMLFPGCIYEATRNNKQNGYSNSQLLILLSMPSDDDIENMKPLTMYACPCGKKGPDRHFFETVPSEDEVINNWGWKKVKVVPAMENFVTSGHIMAYRKQYAMNHVGASTVR